MCMTLKRQRLFITRSELNSPKMSSDVKLCTRVPDSTNTLASCLALVQRLSPIGDIQIFSLCAHIAPAAMRHRRSLHAIRAILQSDHMRLAAIAPSDLDKQE